MGVKRVECIGSNVAVKPLRIHEGHNHCMCWCRTWISFFSNRWTTAGWKSSSMASHCSGERNWPLTPPWCLPLGATRRQCAATSGAALDQARRRKERTYPELAQPHGRARLVVLGCEVGGRWSEETRQFLTGAAAKARSEAGNHEKVDDALFDGALLWRVPQQGRFLCLCWKVGVVLQLMAPLPRPPRW